MNVIVHYERGNKKLLEHLIPGTVKYLKNETKIYRFESIVLSFIKKLSNIKDKENIYSELISLRNEMMILKKKKFGKNAFSIF